MLPNYFKVTPEGEKNTYWVNLAAVQRIGLIMIGGPHTLGFDLFFADGSTLTVSEPSEIKLLAKLLDAEAQIAPREQIRSR
jgi:hypothetical protein